MQLTQNEYLFLYLVAVICVVASFIFIRKKPRDPVKLRLQNSNKKPVSKNPNQASQTRVNPQPNQGSSRKEKALNAFFEFNGAKYDAFEILNLPAGSSIKAAQSAFNAQFLSAEGNHRALLKAALEAIRTR